MIDAGDAADAAAAFEDQITQARLMEDKCWKVLEELKELDNSDVATEIFRAALTAVREQHDAEEDLQNKRLEIEAELVAQKERVAANVVMKNDDEEAVIRSLRKEVQKAWEDAETSRRRELELRRSIRALRSEVAALTRQVETGEGIVLEEEAELRDLVSQRDVIAGEQEATLDSIQRLRAEETEIQAKITRIERERQELVLDKNNIEQRRKDKVNEGRREEERRTRLEREVVDLRGQLEQMQAHLVEQQLENEAMGEKVRAAEVKVREATSTVDKLRKEVNERNAEAGRLTEELHEQTHRNTQYVAENAKREVLIRQFEEEGARVREEIGKTQKIRETTLQMTARMQRRKVDLEKDKAQLQAEVAALERDNELVVKEVELLKKRQDGYVRERDVLNKLRTSKDAQTVKIADLIKVVENNKVNLTHEIAGYQVEGQRQMRIMHDLEMERDRLTRESEAASLKHVRALEEVRVREVAIVDLQRRILEVESRLKQQQNLYESVRSDRNLYSKNLVEAQDEIQEMKRRFKMMTHTITQLKDVIKQKYMEMVVYQLKKENIGKATEQISDNLGKVQQQVTEADEVVANQRKELEKLNRIINEADQELARQKKEYDIVVNERDILGAQLIKRNQELAKVYERIKVQQSMLAAGQAQFRDRVSEITALRRRLEVLKAELEALQTSVSDVGGLRHETHQLRRRLLREQAKVKALQEELMVPMNVHRWRKLEGSDPETFEHIQHIQVLQRRLISKTEEVLEKDLMIQEKEKLYLELKNILARQPGPEVVEQLGIYRKSYKEKSGQLNRMEEDLKHYQAQTLEHKYEIERMVAELQGLKDAWFRMRRQAGGQSAAGTLRSTAADDTAPGSPRWAGSAQEGLQAAMAVTGGAAPSVPLGASLDVSDWEARARMDAAEAAGDVPVDFEAAALQGHERHGAGDRSARDSAEENGAPAGPPDENGPATEAPMQDG